MIEAPSGAHTPSLSPQLSLPPLATTWKGLGVHNEERCTGVGRALYTSLLSALALQGFYNAYAGIALPNPASVGLHEAVGFRPVGVYRGVGYKLDAWHDVGWWHLALRERRADLDPPADLPSMLGQRGGASH